MSAMKNLTFFAFLVLATLTGCSVSVTQSAVVTLKTPHFRFSDAAFITYSAQEVRIEAFVLGHKALSLQSGQKICIDGTCMLPKSFNAHFLSPYYPKTLLREVLQGAPLLGGAQVITSSDGFAQELKKEGKYHISYKVTRDTIRFSDRTNGILIALRILPDQASKE
ncbi:MAG: hypothetical protein KU37_06195 [Sulfuricurvum sp. PC08-66]|nr:MAG: hypothetical protein KU37_06195 [Sulfuricurvum sp. PC08-66]